MPRIALLSTSDTDLLSARASGGRLRARQPGPRLAPGDGRLADCDLVVARILGRPEDLCSGFRHYRDAGVPMVVVGGEREPSAELMEQSTVPIGVCVQAHRYLAEGGPANLGQLHAFLSDTVLLTGEGFDEPQAAAGLGRAAAAGPGGWSRRRSTSRTGRASASCSTRPTTPPGTTRSCTTSPTPSTRPATRSAVPIYSSSLRGASRRAASRSSAPSTR